MTQEFVVYSKTNCHMCDLVKELLDSHSKDYTFYDINIHKVDANFFKREGHTETPQVYLDGKLIGGYDELYTYLYIGFEKEDGELVD